MFYYSFSVINTMFVPSTALLYEQNSNNKIVHNSIEHFLCNLSDFFSDDVLSCLWIVFTNSVFQVPPQKIVRRVEILGIGWPGVIGLTWNESVPWEVMPEVFKCSVWEMRHHLILNLEKNTWISWRQERTSSEKKSDGLHKKCSTELWIILLFQLLLCCNTAARCTERT